VVLVRVQGGQMRGTILNLRGLREPPFLVFALSKDLKFLFMIIFIIMIAYYLVENLIWFAT